MTTSTIKRPGEKHTPSSVLANIGWLNWGLSAIATASALRVVVSVILGLLLPLVGLNLGAFVLVAEWAVAGVIAFKAQEYITSLERPAFEGHVSMPVLLTLLLDLTINSAGAYVLMPFVLATLGVEWNRLLATGISGLWLTLAPEIFLTMALIEHRKGY